MRTLLTPIVALLLFVACNKKEQTSPPPIKQDVLLKSQNKVTVTEDGILSFSSRDAFDETVSRLATFNSKELKQWQELNGFYGFLNQSSNSLSLTESEPPNYNSSVDDSVFLSLLDKFGIVQIEGYYFKAEVNNGLVWAIGQPGNIRDSLKVYLTQLRTRTFNPAVMNRFNLAEEDAFEKLDSGYVGIDQAPLLVPEGLFGTEHKVNDDEWQTGGVTWRADCKSVYQKAVFYFSLVSEMKYMSGFIGTAVWSPRSTEIWLSDNVPPSTKCTYTRRRTTNQVNINEPSNSVTNNKFTWRPYSGSRALISYDLDSRFGYISVPTSTTRFVRVRILKS